MPVGPSRMLPGRLVLGLFALGLVASGCGPRHRPVEPPRRPVHAQPGSDPLIAMANKLLGRGEWAHARKVAEAALAREPRHVGARLVLAIVAWYEGDTHGSNDLLHQALALEPHNHSGLIMLAGHLQAEGRYAESLAVLDRLSSSDDDEFQVMMLRLAAHYATLDATRGREVANAMFEGHHDGHYGHEFARGRAEFLIAVASEQPLVEISGIRADVELEIHPWTGAWFFARIGGQRRAVMLSLYRSESWIDAELATSLGLASMGDTTLYPEPLGVTVVPEIELGDLRIARVPAIIDDLEPYELGEPGFHVDLVLGLQVLHRFGAIVMDHPQHRLSLELVAPSGPPAGAVERPLLLLDAWLSRIPITPIAIDGSTREFWAWFGYVGFGAITIRQAPWLAAGHTLAELGEVDLPNTGGGDMVFVEQVAFGRLRISGVGGMVHRDQPDEPTLKAIESVVGLAIGGAINAGLLEQLRVTWVPSRAAIWLERPNHGHWLPQVL